jgi:hypothetical protein
LGQVRNRLGETTLSGILLTKQLIKNSNNECFSFYINIKLLNSHNITQTYNTKINKYLELSVAMSLWCLEKISILPFIISATGIVFDSVGSLVGSTECLLIWIVLDLKTHKLGLLFIVSEFTSFSSRLRTTRQSSLVGVGGYLARPVKYSWRL